MSYQSTVDVLRTAANAVNTGRFIHGRKMDASSAYTGLYPLIFLYPFQTRTAVDPDFIDTHDLLIGFFQEDKPDSSPEERELLVSEMDDLSTDFIAALEEMTDIKLTNVIKEPQYQIYSQTISGYAVRFNLQNFTPCEDEDL
jgi:hypothetical protein